MAAGDPVAFGEGVAHSRGEVPHPRDEAGWTNMPAAATSKAMSHMRGIHRTVGREMEKRLSSKVKDIRAKPAAMTPQRETEMIESEKALDFLSTRSKDPMENSIARVQQTAMSPIHAVREHFNQTGEMLPVSAGEFYGKRHAIGQALTQHYFSDPERQLRAELATPEWSARTTPQQEVTGASGMLAVLRQGKHIKMSVNQDLANLFNTPEKQGGWKGGAGGATPMQAGDYTLESLSRRHPQAASILMQHKAREEKLVPPSNTKGYEPDRLAIVQNRNAVLSAGATVDLPDSLRDPTRAMVSSLGAVGFPKAARSMTRFNTEPEEFGGGTFHKIPSYTWNIHQHDEVMAKGTHHFLGVLAHGDKWLEANPDAHAALAQAREHKAWTDPTSTIDVWSGRVASGLPMQGLKTGAFGKISKNPEQATKDATNPESLLKGSGIKRTGGARYGSPGDMGYFYGEEAHRQAAQDMSINVKGLGRMNAPAHVVQSLSWYGVQAEENAHQVRMGNVNMTPHGMEDSTGLNSLQFPQVFGRPARQR